MSSAIYKNSVIFQYAWNEQFKSENIRNIPTYNRITKGKKLLSKCKQGSTKLFIEKHKMLLKSDKNLNK